MNESPETIYAQPGGFIYAFRMRFGEWTDREQWAPSTHTAYRRADLLDATLAERDTDISNLRSRIRAINSSMTHHAETMNAKLAERDAEIERLRGEVASLKDRIHNANNAYATLCEKLDHERLRARMPEELIQRAAWFDAVPDRVSGRAEAVRGLLRDILAWHEQQ
jgi:predicted  nucleic acid-binding Zn-ribbon protein